MKNYYLILFGTALLFSISCGTNGPKADKNDIQDKKTDTATVIPEKKLKNEPVPEKSLPKFTYLDTFALNSGLGTVYNDYKKKALNPDLLTSEKELIQFFDNRKKIIQSFEGPLSDIFYQLDEKQNYDAQSAIEDELQKIGIQGVYVEGMLGGLTGSDFMTDKISELGSEAFQMYMNFKAAHSNSLGGEYPFLGLSGYDKMLTIGEEMIKKYPESEYSKKIIENYNDAIEVFTDVHKVINKGHTHYCVFGISKSYYPFATEIEDHQNFVKNNPGSKFTPVISKILNTISVLDLTKNEEEVNAIEIHRFKEIKKAKEKVYNYIKQGIDVPHVISQGAVPDSMEYIVAYRFFSDAKMADDALNTIKPQFPDAKISTVSLKDEY